MVRGEQRPAGRANIPVAVCVDKQHGEAKNAPVSALPVNFVIITAEGKLDSRAASPATEVEQKQ